MAESAYGSCAFAILLSMLALWGINIRVRDPTFIDAFWGIGFAMQALLCIPHAGFSLHSLIMASIVCVWGARLGRYLFGRWRKYGPDRRYQELLQRLGGNPIITSLYAVFLAQGLAMWIVGLPIQYAASSHAGLSFQKLIGAFIAVAGLLTESLADWQMASFRAQNGKEKLMDQGLWRYSRHPNFFGSSVFWWGIYLFAAPSFISWPIISPIYMTFLLVSVTGVPPIEKKNRNDPEYQAYKRRTHMFIPWFPKDASNSHHDDTNEQEQDNSQSLRTSDRSEQSQPQQQQQQEKQQDRPRFGINERSEIDSQGLRERQPISRMWASSGESQGLGMGQPLGLGQHVSELRRSFEGKTAPGERDSFLGRRELANDAGL